MMGLLNVVANSVKGGGIAGLVATLLVLAAQHWGVDIAPDQAAAIVGLVVTLAVHLIPDSKKQQITSLANSLNMQVSDLAAMVPQIEAVYPTGKNGASGKDQTNVSNINGD